MNMGVVVVYNGRHRPRGPASFWFPSLLLWEYLHKYIKSFSLQKLDLQKVSLGIRRIKS